MIKLQAIDTDQMIVSKVEFENDDRWCYVIDFHDYETYAETIEDLVRCIKEHMPITVIARQNILNEIRSMDIEQYIVNE